jgi:hypothetical protein
MLIESVNDVKYFFVMVVLCIMSFSNAILILQTGQKKLNEQIGMDFH